VSECHNCQGHPFGFKQLLAGERQLLAMVMIWALKEASGAPMPVIVDTPPGRLDSDHRLSVVQNYFPRASHQVVLLATDAEVDDQIWPSWPRRFRGLTV
jgi:DNA sulfur modification protein DndD